MNCLYFQVTVVGNALRFYDTKEKTSRFLWGAGSGISSFAVSLFGRLLAYATKGPNPVIHVHVLRTMEHVIALDAPEGTAHPEAEVSALAFSRDGTFLAVATAVPDLTLSLRNARTGQVVVASTLESEATGISFNPFNAFEILVHHASGAPSGAAGATLHAVDKVYETHSVERRVLDVRAVGVAPSAITAAVWSPENTIYLATDAGALLVVRPATGGVIAPPEPIRFTSADVAGSAAAWVLTPGSAAVSVIAFTKHHVLLGGTDGTLRFYSHAKLEAPPGHELPELHLEVAMSEGEYENMTGASFNPVFDQGVVTTAEGGVYVLDIQGDIAPNVGGVAAGDVSSAGPETDAEHPPVDTPSVDEPGSKEAPVSVVKVGDYHAGAVTGVASLADGTSVATCGVDGTLRGWDLRDPGTCAWKRTLSSEQALMTSGSVAAGSGMIAVASATGVVRVFDAGAGAAAPPRLTLRERLTADVPDAISMNPSGTWLAVAGAYGDCWLVEIATADAARVVGYVALPARALGMTWATDAQLLVSGEGGEVAAVTPPPAGYTPPFGMAIEAKDGVVQSVMVDCALTAITVPAPGRLAGIAADRSVRTYTLPSDAAGWGGRDGRVLAADVVEPGGLGKALGGIASIGGVLATASGDGTVAVWTDGDRLARGLHDAAEGGAAALAVVPGGRLATAGRDGAVVVTSSPGMPHLEVAFGLKELVAVKASAPPAAEYDDFDDPEEPTTMDKASAAALAEMQGGGGAAAAKADAAVQLDPEVAAAREAMAVKIADLRKRLEETIARNDAAEEREKIPRGEILVDEAFRAQLVAEGDKRVGALRKELVLENLRNDYAASKIKEACWDTMEVHGSAIVAFKSPGLEVHNYPLKMVEKSAKLAARVAFLRRVEMKEEEYLAHPENGGAEDTFDLRVDVPKEGEEGGEGGDAPPTEGEAAAAAAASTPKGDSFEAIVYPPFKLFPARRKMSQLIMLQMVTREIKAQFNAEFHEMTGTKTTYMDKLSEYNQRITEIRNELKSHTTDHAPLFEPKLAEVETEGSVLKVDDSEIKAEVYVSPEEQARRAAEAEAEAERLRSKGADDPTERALKQMMGGVLESDKGAAEMEELPKPDWMLEIDKEDWTEEQVKLAKEWEGKAKAFREELEKRRTALDAELKKLREDVDEVTKKFDDLLADFSNRRNATDGRLAEIESWVVACADEAETALDDDERRQAAMAEELAELKSAKVDSGTAVADFRREVDGARERYDSACAEDRNLAKIFKRDFADTEDFFEVLFTLYKRRKNPPRIEADASGGRKARSSLRGAARRVSMAAARLSRGAAAGRPSGGGSGAVAMAARIARASNLSVLSAGSETPNPDDKALALVLASKHDPFSTALGGPVTAESLRPKPPPVDPLEVEYDRPEGLDLAWWDRLVEYRERKIVQEAQVTELKNELDEMQRYLAKISGEDAKLQARIDELIMGSREFAQERFRKLYDLSVPLRMKQGEVELMVPDLSLGGGPAANAVRADTMLLHRSVVEDLNEVIQQHGGGKVDTLVAIKDFKKGIYDLQWENTKLEMESADLVEKTKQLQLARVGKNFQEILKGAAKASKDEDDGGKKGEVASLEARLNHNRKLHERSVAEKKLELKKMKRKIRERAQQNDEISVQVSEMDESVGEQLRVQENRTGGSEFLDGRGGNSARSLSSRSHSSVGQGLGGNSSSAAAERKMRALVTQQKLRDIAKAQAEEMMMLRSELERARLRTFPSFVERNGGPPDM